MKQMHNVRLSAAAMVLAAFSAACSDNAPTSALENTAHPNAPQFAIIPSPSQVVIQGIDAGDFRSFVANFSGRDTSEFWDNHSADEDGTLSPPAYRCNSGFFASGNFSLNCKNEALGSGANAGGYDKFWGDGAKLYDPSSFMFNGTYSYNITLKGSFAGASSTIGYFTRDITGYHYTPLVDFSARIINSTAVINTGGANWGFYITNSFNTDLAGCDIANPTQSACSDATGGFSSQLFQQHALFMNTTQTGYLVGIEDNRLEVGGTRDSDYNDYMISVDPIAYDPPVVGNSLGCSPGYWKNHNFPAGYSKTQLFSQTSFGGSTFENAFPGKTLQQVLELGGGGLNALGRQTVSAYFNALTINTFEKTAKQVIDGFNGVFPGTNYDTLKNEYEALTDINGRTCPNPTGK